MPKKGSNGTLQGYGGVVSVEKLAQGPQLKESIMRIDRALDFGPEW